MDLSVVCGIIVAESQRWMDVQNSMPGQVLSLCEAKGVLFRQELNHITAKY